MTDELRRRVIETCLAMNTRGINQGRSGNVSVRIDATSFLITPTGIAYDEIRLADVVRMTADGTWYGRTPPSSEWRCHRDILTSRADVAAIVHTHGPHATALACLRKSIPAFHYVVALAGGDSIRCAPYATFGTQRLSDHALAALEGRRACLLANHGMIATGPTLSAALDLAVEVEALAGMYLEALSVGRPVLLSKAEIKRVVDKFRTYGTPDWTDPELRHGGTRGP
ncbi:MAG TPA: class II aldolase/adducin family protein [Kofleriaceae bacterium]|nr:class II aldolase/adducin family protein [Kofleriaceae bacterium]